MGDGYIFEIDRNVSREGVCFKNRFGIILAGDLYAPVGLDTSEKHPALLVGPPYGGVKEQGAGVWANQLAQRGFVVLAFDPSYNGESGGEPRHVSSPDIFTEDFSAGVDYLGTLAYVDRDRIGAVGICGSGAFVLTAAQVDIRIKAVATASMVDMSAFGGMMDEDAWDATARRLAAQRWADMDAGEPQYIPSFPAELADEVPEGLDPMAAEFFEFYGLKRGHHPRARGNFTTTSDMSFLNFQELQHLDRIAPRPIMLIVGTEAFSRSFSDTAFAQASEPKQLVEVPGANHIDLYDDVAKIPFDAVEAFFKESL